MFDQDKWKEIWQTITQNKVRSILTAFGVFWGIFMLIVLIGAGNSFKFGILKSVDGFATNTCFFQTNRTKDAYKGYRKGRQWRMKNSDIKLIEERASSVEYISPVLFKWEENKNVVFKQKSGSFSMRGIYPQHFKIEAQNILAGRLFNLIDSQNKRKVCVIGSTVAKTLFNDNNSIGEYIKVNGIYFQIIGVISPKSSATIGTDVEETVFVPFTTMQQAFNMGDNVHFLACTAKPGYSAEQVETEVSSILKSANEISPTDVQAVRSFNIEKQFKMFNNLFIGIDILIWIIGVGTLFTGIVGISNIMMVTVRERTREIGVRRAIGAKPVDILMQIMSESFVLTGIAGLGGFLLGVGFLELITKVIFSNPVDMPFVAPTVSFYTALAAMFILMISGILAGLIPSLRALKIKAIDAIRDE